MALSYRSSSAANGGSAAVATTTCNLPTGWAAGDLVYFLITVGTNSTSHNTPTGWTVRNDLNAASDSRTVLAYRTLQTGDTDPVFTWTNNGKWVWTGICIQPAAGATAAHSGLATPTLAAANTTHTSPAYAAGAVTGMSILMSGYRAAVNGATAITTTPPTNWTEPASNADNSTAVGTTTNTRQVASWHSYWAGQTGTVTPGSQTISVSSPANLYHVFAEEQGGGGAAFLPAAPIMINQAAIVRAHYW